MKKTIVAAGAVLALATSLSIAGEATKTPTAGIDAPPRDPAQVGITRTTVQDSTLAGGSGWSPNGTRISFCTLNPADAACGGGGTTQPPPPPPPPAAAVRAGCMVDTVAFDTMSDGDCFGSGYTNTDMIVFSVGDTMNNGGEGGDALYFANPALYRVTWSGNCASGSGTGGYEHVCFIHAPGVPWRMQRRRVDVTVTRVSDGVVVLSRRINAEKETCNNTLYTFGCPRQP